MVNANKIYTEDEAYALTREEQMTVLARRGVKFDRKDKEKQLVYKIFKSNPAIEEEDKHEKFCHKCGAQFDVTALNPHGVDFKCPKCGAMRTKVY